MAAAVIGLSPVIMTVRMPMRRSSAKRSRMPPLTMSLRWMTPSSLPSLATASGVPPDLAIPSAMALTSRVELGADRRLCARGAPALTVLRRLEVIEHRVDRALADPRAVDLDAAHPALRGERDELGAELVDVAAADAVFLLGQHDDRAALRRLVGERGELRRVGQLLLASRR